MDRAEGKLRGPWKGAICIGFPQVYIHIDENIFFALQILENLFRINGYEVKFESGVTIVESTVHLACPVLFVDQFQILSGTDRLRMTGQLKFTVARQ